MVMAGGPRNIIAFLLLPLLLSPSDSTRYSVFVESHSATHLLNAMSDTQYNFFIYSTTKLPTQQPFSGL